MAEPLTVQRIAAKMDVILSAANDDTMMIKAWEAALALLATEPGLTWMQTIKPCRVGVSRKSRSGLGVVTASVYSSALKHKRSGYSYQKAIADICRRRS